MVSRRLTLIGCLLAALTVAFGVAVPLHAAPVKNTLVLVTQKTSALTELSVRELKRLYTAEPVTGPDGTALIPLNHAVRSPARVAFDQLVLKMSPDVVGRFWIDRKIRGQTSAPKVVPSLDLLRKVIAALPGTVTYLNANDVTPDLKILNIDGKGPTDPDYPLHFE